MSRVEGIGTNNNKNALHTINAAASATALAEAGVSAPYNFQDCSRSMANNKPGDNKTWKLLLELWDPLEDLLTTDELRVLWSDAVDELKPVQGAAAPPPAGRNKKHKYKELLQCWDTLSYSKEELQIAFQSSVKELQQAGKARDPAPGHRQ